MGQGEKPESPLNGTQGEDPVPFSNLVIQSRTSTCWGASRKSPHPQRRMQILGFWKRGRRAACPALGGQEPFQLPAGHSCGWGRSKSLCSLGRGRRLPPTPDPHRQSKTPAAPGKLRKPHLHRPSKQACQTEAGPGERNPPTTGLAPHTSNRSLPTP